MSAHLPTGPWCTRPPHSDGAVHISTPVRSKPVNLSADDYETPGDGFSRLEIVCGLAMILIAAVAAVAIGRL